MRYGPIHVQYEPSVSSADSIYFDDAFREIFPLMLEIVGEPKHLDTLTVDIWDKSGGAVGKFVPYMVMPRVRSKEGADDDEDGRVDEDLYDLIDNDGDDRVDEDLDTNPSWDGIFVHEMTHAIQFDDDDMVDNWMNEGMAEAAVHFVSTRLAGRRKIAPLRSLVVGVANYDMISQGSSQVFGGLGDLAFRPDFDRGYQLAAATFLIPSLAELDSRPDLPHPLARLTRALWDEEDAEGPFSLYRAIDRAWTTPVDGISPPSRWVRASALSNTSLRSTLVYAILPLAHGRNLNPSGFDFFVSHTGFDEHYERSTPTGPLSFRGVPGRDILDVPFTGYRNALRQLPAGAWMLEGTEQDGSGQAVTARTWFLVTSNRESREIREGIAVVFIDDTGRPVDLPDLVVNGRIIERVPGGVIAAPLSSLNPDGAITFESGGRVIGTVTVPGGFPRLIAIPVSGTSGGAVVEWTPYVPAAGDSLFVSILREESSLEPGDSSIECSFCDWEGRLVSSTFLEPGPAGRWTGRLHVPPGVPGGSLSFRAGSSTHGRCRGSQNNFLVLDVPQPAPVGIHRIGSDVVVRLDATSDGHEFVLAYAASAEGPWTTVNQPPAADGRDLRWTVPTEPSGRLYVRIGRLPDPEEQILVSAVLGSDGPRAIIEALAPFPNPSRDGFRWTLRLDSTQRLDLEVFDVTGRRVFGPVTQDLPGGTPEVRWHGVVDGGPATSGIYFMRLSGGGTILTRKVVLASGSR